jgi:hypothetical protein
MHSHGRWSFLLILISMLAVAPPLFAQGQGADKGNKQGEAKGKQQRGKSEKAQRPQENKEKGKARAQDKRQADQPGKSGKAARKNEDRGNSGKVSRFRHNVALNDLKPDLRRFIESNRASDRIAAGAASRAFARGVNDDDVVIRHNGNRVALFNRSGVMLVDLDEQRARNLGGWRVRPYDDDVKSGAPAFCRSGEGHPVFGRDWCREKGFGLGDYRDIRWGRTTDVRDISFQRQVDRGTLARAVLIDVLGDVVFNRLGLHAVTLGYTDPLTGVWLGEPSGPQVLRLSSGQMTIAEIYDDNRDNQADALLVALRPW